MWAQPDLRARFPTHPSPVAVLPFAVATFVVFVVLTICSPSFGWHASRLMVMPKLRASESARMPRATSCTIGTRQAGLNPLEKFYSSQVEPQNRPSVTFNFNKIQPAATFPQPPDVHPTLTEKSTLPILTSSRTNNMHARTANSMGFKILPLTDCSPGVNS
jgi:hypothetical protein